MKQKAVAIFDVGKTNKKVFLLDEQYNIVQETSQKFDETIDEDGFACEDLAAVIKWVQDNFRGVLSHKDFAIKAVNFSAYGASFVHLDKSQQPLTPLYNYLKPFPIILRNQFYETHGNESLIAKQTASPVLGNLNSGMQLYRLKYEQPETFQQIHYSLHLPQYLSFLITSRPASDLTSVGCHTQLWHFQNQCYHPWVLKEKMDAKLAPLQSADRVFYSSHDNSNIATGIGLHDSSAALIPYLALCKEPFILLSTGTWCISLNPFNSSILSDYELANDCLSYLTHEGKAVKASRLFAGYEHEEQVKRISAHFDKHRDYYKTIRFDDSLINKLHRNHSLPQLHAITAMVQQSSFSKRQMSDFETYEEAYHQLIFDIIRQQLFSTKLVLKDTLVTQIFVDGGFGQNEVYMNLLAAAFPYLKIYAATVTQASALGAALVMHKHFTKQEAPASLVALKYYPANPKLEMVI